MADTTQDLAKEIITGTVSETVARLLDAEVPKALLLPGANEAGLLLAELTSAVRFYATDNLKKLLPRWANRRQHPLTEAELRRVMPLLQNASMESDESMQERWAKLLDGVANADEGVLPSFGVCLAQMTSREALFLESLWVGHWWGTGVDVRFENLERDFLTLFAKEGLLDPSDQRKLKAECASVVTDLVRMGILRITTKAESYQPILSENSAWPSSLGPARTRIGEHRLVEVYEISSYGVGFMRSITERQQSEGI